MAIFLRYLEYSTRVQTVSEACGGTVKAFKLSTSALESLYSLRQIVHLRDVLKGAVTWVQVLRNLNHSRFLKLVAQAVIR